MINTLTSILISVEYIVYDEKHQKTRPALPVISQSTLFVADANHAFERASNGAAKNAVTVSL